MRVYAKAGTVGYQLAGVEMMDQALRGLTGAEKGYEGEMNAVRRLIADTFRLPPEAISGESTIENTEAWDSLKHMELIISIEEKFGLILDGDEIARMISVAAVEEVLRSKGVEV